MILYMDYVNNIYNNILEDLKKEILNKVNLLKNDILSVDFDNHEKIELIIYNLNSSVPNDYNFLLNFNYIDSVWTVNCNYNEVINSDIVLNEVVFEFEIQEDNIIIKQDLIVLAKKNNSCFLIEYLFCEQYNGIITFLNDYDYKIGLSNGIFCNDNGDISIANKSSDILEPCHDDNIFLYQYNLLKKLSDNHIELVNLILFENKKLNKDEIESYILLYDIDFTNVNDFEFLIDIKKLKMKNEQSKNKISIKI